MSISHESLRLVVPIDRTSANPEALAYAGAIARDGDEILLLNAIQLDDINPVVLPRGLTVAGMRRTVRKDAEGDLAEIAAGVHAPIGVNVRSVVADGAPAEVILQHATPSGNAMIVMASHGRGAIGRLTYGSVADRVARASSVPVLLVRLRDGGDPTEIEPIRRLVVPLDGSARSEQALPPAIRLAKRLNVPIRLVAVSEVDKVAMIYGGELPPAAWAELATEAEGELAKTLDAVAGPIRAEGIEVDLHVLAGPVAAAIEAAVAPGDIIVMTSHGRSGVRRWIIGSVAERLGRTAPVPVMLVPSIEAD